MACAAAALAASGGCGGGQQTVSSSVASAMSDALTQLSVLCGDAQIVQAARRLGPGWSAQREVAQLDSSALGQASKLAALTRRGPDLQYQGESARDVARDESRDLESCGLRAAARALAPTAR